MKISRVTAVYFSPAGHTRKVTETAAAQIAERLGTSFRRMDFTLPESRTVPVHFSSDELIVFGTPTYAGRVPNKVLPFVQSLFFGRSTPAVSIVTFGNRNFDSSLTELCQELEKNGFRTFAAAAFPCAHVFSEKIGAGRPDEQDMEILADFADAVSGKIQRATEMGALGAPLTVCGGAPVAPYYTPLGTDEKPAKFLRAKPKTNPEKCTNCGICAKICPFGSINPENVSDVPGICVKCQACILQCPEKAKYFDNPAFLSHVAYLEQNCMDRKEPTIYI